MEQQQIKTGHHMNLRQTQQPKYFQKQSRLSNLCGLHLVNNYFGSKKYTVEMMNEVCYGLSQDCINPHKSIFGGNYDVNVLMKVFQLEEIDLVYHDKRKDLEISNDQTGFIVNQSGNECCLFKYFEFGRHWKLFKRQGQGFVQYDSLKNEPILHTQQSLLDHLRQFNNSQSTVLKMIPFSHTEVLPANKKQ